MELGVAPRDVDVRVSPAQEPVQDAVDPRGVLGVAKFLPREGILHLVNHDVVHPVIVAQEAVQPIGELVGVTALGVRVVIEGDSHCLGLRYPRLAQPLGVQVEEQVRHAASLDSSGYPYRAVLTPPLEFADVARTFDSHVPLHSDIARKYERFRNIIANAGNLRACLVTLGWGNSASYFSSHFLSCSLSCQISADGSQTVLGAPLSENS